MLIVVTGRPGTGKTTLARSLAGELRAAYLRIDAIETALQVYRNDHGPVGAEGYAVAHRLADANLRLSLDVVVDAVCPVPESRTAWSATADDAGARLLMIETYLPDADEHRRRVSERQPDMPDQRVPTWQEVKSSEWVAWDESRDGPRMIVDTRSAEAALAAVRSVISPPAVAP